MASIFWSGGHCNLKIVEKRMDSQPRELHCSQSKYTTDFMNNYFIYIFYMHMLYIYSLIICYSFIFLYITLYFYFYVYIPIHSHTHLWREMERERERMLGHIYKNSPGHLIYYLTVSLMSQ